MSKRATLNEDIPKIIVEKDAYNLKTLNRRSVEKMYSLLYSITLCDRC